VGALYEWQNKDKQRALDMIVQGKAEARRPEYPDDTVKDTDPRTDAENGTDTSKD
jgi:hypothetical protein